MKIVGCDLHTRYRQIAMLDAETGELVERRLEHESGEARAFYEAQPMVRSVCHPPLRGRGICRNAGTHPLTNDRTRSAAD